ncbi:hypothetical protein PENFLA_c014G01500 [Penicillium flavigenum]|uniref:HNH nuclease domain-containing protein n=1 Tax=Penicillium flavigenum TaxID=254877 RepID=A0A1V6T5H9_9EURO|nr:hypothetical protein PENFLA_c014G01500 [Penicillium flavigenum]
MARPLDGQQDPLHIFSEFDDPLRQQLVHKIVEDDKWLRVIPRQNLYALWFSDLDVLQKMANAQTAQEREIRRRALRRVVAQYDVPRIWASEGHTNTTSRAEALPGSASSSRLPWPGLRERSRSRSPNVRSPTAAAATRERSQSSASVWREAREEEKKTVDLASESGTRDDHQCVVTKRGLPLIESVHILSKKLNGTKDENPIAFDCWDWLKDFWGEEKVGKLRSLLLSEGTMDMERLYNRITLEVHVHRYWDRAQIALHPIWVSEDRTEMQISFHWLPLKENMPGAAKHNRTDLISTSENPYQDPKYRPRETPGRNNVIFNTETGARISSGYVFTVKTDNKDERPLPSMELLELRWHLSRIAHMQGAAEDEDSDYESDNGSVSVRLGSRSTIKE